MVEAVWTEVTVVKVPSISAPDCTNDGTAVSNVVETTAHAN